MSKSSNPARQLRSQCPSCKGTFHVLVMSLYDQEQVQDSPYSLVSCQKCRLEFIIDPPPAKEIFKHYPSDNSAYAGELGDRISPVKKFLFWLDGRPLLNRLKSGDVILDVGAGLGTFAHYLSKRGMKVAATDFVTSQDWARKSIPYIQLDLNQMAVSKDSILQALGGKPHAVVLRHVLEHVYEPARLITWLSELDPEYFLIVVPNGRSWFRHLFGPHWGFYDPPRHLSNFTKQSLAFIFNQAGYRVEETTSYGMDEIVISLYRAGRQWNPSVRKWFSWTSPAMLLSSAVALLMGRSVLVLLARKNLNN